MDIRQVSLDLPYIVDVVLPISPLKHVTSVDVDRKTGELYWTDTSEDVIHKSTPDGKVVRAIMWHELLMAEAIAIDSAGRKVSWDLLDPYEPIVKIVDVPHVVILTFMGRLHELNTNH